MLPPTTTTKQGEEGYTLLELLIVVAIIGLISAAAPTVYAGLVPQFQVRQFAEDIADKARELRILARQDGTIHWMEFANGSNTVLVDGEPWAGLDDMSLVFNAENTWSGASTDRVEFYPNGSNSGGDIALSIRNIEVVVTFDWVTGAAEVKQ